MAALIVPISNDCDILTLTFLEWFLYRSFPANNSILPNTLSLSLQLSHPVSRFLHGLFILSHRAPALRVHLTDLGFWGFAYYSMLLMNVNWAESRAVLEKQHETIHNSFILRNMTYFLMKQNMWLKIMWGTASCLGSLNYISRKRKEKEFKSRKNVLMKQFDL